MKTKIIYLISFFQLFINIYSFSQNTYHYKIPPNIPSYNNIQIPIKVKNTMDVVFPGVIFRYVSNAAEKGDGVGILQAVLNGEIYELPKAFNLLIKKLYGSGDQTKTVNTDKLVEGYAYLNLIIGPYPYIINNNLGNITVSRVDYKYPKSDHSDVSDSLRSFNYKVVVDFTNSNNKDSWQRAELYFRVTNNLIESGYGTVKMKTGYQRELSFWRSYSFIKQEDNIKRGGEKSSLNPDGYGPQFEIDVQHTQYVIPIPYAGVNNIYIQTEKNGSTTGAQTQFIIHDLNNIYSNPTLKVFTCEDFGSKTLLLSTPIVFQSDGTGLTSMFIPNHCCPVKI